MSYAVTSYLMPFSNVAYLPLTEKFVACRVAGYPEMSIMPVELEALLARGISLREIVARASAEGVRISRLDPLNTWPRLWRPDNMDEAYITSVNTTPERFFELAEGLGCTHASLNALFPYDSMPLDEVTQHYAAICRRASEHGLSCDLEFIPLWGVPTLEMAWAIVSGAGEANGGLVLDSWHFVRGGSSLEALEAVPGEVIHCVQLNDGSLKLPSGATLKSDCYNRLFPGEGEFPLIEMVQALAEKRALRQLGPEVFSPLLESMSAAEVAQRSHDSVSGVLRRAGVI